MKINFISQNITNFKNQKSNYNYAAKSNPSSDDIFIKTTPSFMGVKIFTDKRYLPLKLDVINYTMFAEKLTPNGLKNIINKYIQNVNIEDISNMPKDKGTRFTAGYTTENIGLRVAQNGKIEAVACPPIVYLPFQKIDSKEDRIIFTDKALHEFTHVLQQTTPGGSEINKLINNYLKKTSDTQQVVKTLRTSQQIFTLFEYRMLENLFGAFNHRIEAIPTVIYNKNKNSLYRLLKNKYNMSDKELIQKNLNYVLALAQKETGIDLKFLLNFIKLKANSEKEAYINALEFDKEILKITDTTDFDIRIALYDAIIQVVQSAK